MIQFEIKAPIGREYDGNEYTIKCMDPGVTFAVELFTVEPISPWRERAIPYQIPEGSTAKLRVTRPDRAYTVTKTIIEGGTILCPVHPYSVTTPGKCSADVAVYGPDGNRLTSATFHFFVDRECAPTAGENAPVFVDSIQGLIEFVEQAADRAEAAADRAESSGGGNGSNPPKDGITPHIGENGNWYIGTTDTGVSAEGEDGEDGGHYTPVVTQPTTDTIRITFTPSKATMPAVAPVTVQLPAPSESNGAGEHPDNPVVDGITVGGENGVRFDSEGEPSTPVLALYGAQGDEPVRVSHVAPAQEDGEAVPLGQVKQLVKEHSGQNLNGAGLSAEEKSLLLAVVNNALYDADIGAVKARLNALWGESGDDSGGGDSDGTDSGTLYTISTKFVNVAIDNTATSATANSAFNATLTPTTGELASVTVTMGGVDVTADVYADGAITIPAVTGNIVISASATAFVNLLADVEWRAGTAADKEAGMTYNAKATEDMSFPAGTYYFYDLFKTAAGGTPSFFAPNGDGTYTILVKGTDYTFVDNNGMFKNGTYNEYNNENSSTYQPNGAGYLVESTVVFLHDVTVRIECISAMLTTSEPGYSWCFTQPYNPLKDTLGWEV